MDSDGDGERGPRERQRYPRRDPIPIRDLILVMLLRQLPGRSLQSLTALCRFGGRGGGGIAAAPQSRPRAWPAPRRHGTQPPRSCCGHFSRSRPSRLVVSSRLSGWARTITRKRNQTTPGETNGLELGDPCCAWDINNPWESIRRRERLSHPGDAGVTSGVAMPTDCASEGAEQREFWDNYYAKVPRRAVTAMCVCVRARGVIRAFARGARFQSPPGCSVAPYHSENDCHNSPPPFPDARARARTRRARSLSSRSTPRCAAARCPAARAAAACRAARHPSPRARGRHVFGRVLDGGRELGVGDAPLAARRRRLGGRALLAALPPARGAPCSMTWWCIRIS